MELPDSAGFTLTIDTHHETGEKIAALTRACPTNAPPAARAAWQVRAEANATGRCSLCGAVMILPNRHERRRAKARGVPAHAAMEHEDWCAASDGGLLRTWVSGAN